MRVGMLKAAYRVWTAERRSFPRVVSFRLSLTGQTLTANGGIGWLKQA